MHHLVNGRGGRPAQIVPADTTLRSLTWGGPTRGRPPQDVRGDLVVSSLATSDALVGRAGGATWHHVPMAGRIRSASLLAPLMLGAAVGAFVGFDPVGAGLVVLALLLGAVAIITPLPLAIAGLALLTIDPQMVIGQSILGIDTEILHKALVLVSFAPAIVRYGLSIRFLVPLAAYGGLLVLTLTLSATPSAFFSSPFDSLLTPALAWIVLSIRWKPTSCRFLLRTVTALAPLSVLAGGVLSVAGIESVYRLGEYETVARLGGATIAPSLAMLALVGASAAIVYRRLFTPRLATTAVVANFAILGMTLSRGALAAGLVVLVPVVVRSLAATNRRVPLPHLLRGVSVLCLATLVVVTLLPAIEARNADFAAKEGSFNTSGRVAAWTYFWEEAQESPVVGHGLGAGPAIGAQTPDYVGGDFTNPHNEYLRLFVDGGYVGLAIVLLAIVATMVFVYRSVPRPVTPDFAAIIAAFAVLSFVDNTLSSPEFMVPFAVLAGVARAASGRLLPVTQHRTAPPDTRDIAISGIPGLPLGVRTS